MAYRIGAHRQKAHARQVFALTLELRTRFRASRVVIFSSDADRANAAAAERAGAVAFLPKDQLSSPTLRRLLEEGADGAD